MYDDLGHASEAPAAVPAIGAGDQASGDGGALADGLASSFAYLPDPTITIMIMSAGSAAVLRRSSCAIADIATSEPTIVVAPSTDFERAVAVAATQSG